jgi:hypothetical protein
MVSCCLSAAGIRFSVILGPPRNPALLTVGLPNHSVRTPTGFPRSAHPSCDRGGRPLCPGDNGARPGPEPLPGRRLPLRSGPVPAPRQPSHRRRSRLTRHQPRVHTCSPVRSSPACGHPDGTGRPWAAPWASHPVGQEPDDARQGGDRPSSTDLELLAQLTIVDLQSSSSLVMCDLASHVASHSSGVLAPGRSYVPPLRSRAL